MRIRFGPFTLDLECRQLTRAGHEIHLEPKAFELLSVLVLERPKALSKADLQARLWPGTFVAEANLSNLVAEIRAALSDPARAPKFVRTAHRFGYAFCGDAVSLTDAGDAAPARLWCRLEANGRRFPLPTGEHVIGRDADVDNQIRHVHGFPPSCTCRRDGRRRGPRRLWQQERDVSRRRTSDVAHRPRRRRYHPHRIRAPTFHVSAPFGPTETHEEAPPWP